MAWERVASVSGVHERQGGDVGASGQSELAHEVSCLETLIRNLGVAIRSSRAKVCEALCFPLFLLFL